MSVSSFLRSIIAWLRAGYPEGVPDVDYVPLFAVLSSHLTEEDVTAFAEELASIADEDTQKIIDDALKGCKNCQPRPDELARVRGRLAAGGWPLAQPGPPPPEQGPGQGPGQA